MRNLVTKTPIILGTMNTVTEVDEMMVMGTTVNHETIINGTGMMGFTTTTTMLTLTGFLVSWEVVIKGVTEVEIEEMIEEMREGMGGEMKERMIDEMIGGITEEWMIKKLMVLIVVNNLHGE